MTQLTAHLPHLSAHRPRRGRLRFSLAEGIERVLRDIDAPRPALAASIPVQRRAVRDAREELTALASQLRTDPTVSSRGLDLTRELLTDACGPLYTPSAPHALADAAHQARVALRHGVDQ